MADLTPTLERILKLENIKFQKIVYAPNPDTYSIITHQSGTSELEPNSIKQLHGWADILRDRFNSTGVGLDASSFTHQSGNVDGLLRLVNLTENACNTALRKSTKASGILRHLNRITSEIGSYWKLDKACIPVYSPLHSGAHYDLAQRIARAKNEDEVSKGREPVHTPHSELLIAMDLAMDEHSLTTRQETRDTITQYGVGPSYTLTLKIAVPDALSVLSQPNKIPAIKQAIKEHLYSAARFYGVPIAPSSGVERGTSLGNSGQSAEK